MGSAEQGNSLPGPWTRDTHASHKKVQVFLSLTKQPTVYFQAPFLPYPIKLLTVHRCSVCVLGFPNSHWLFNPRKPGVRSTENPAQWTPLMGLGPSVSVGMHKEFFLLWQQPRKDFPLLLDKCLLAGSFSPSHLDFVVFSRTLCFVLLLSYCPLSVCIYIGTNTKSRLFLRVQIDELAGPTGTQT